jgi:hypothetical protein
MLFLAGGPVDGSSLRLWSTRLGGFLVERAVPEAGGRSRPSGAAKSAGQIAAGVSELMVKPFKVRELRSE